MELRRVHAINRLVLTSQAKLAEAGRDIVIEGHSIINTLLRLLNQYNKPQ